MLAHALPSVFPAACGLAKYCHTVSGFFSRKAWSKRLSVGKVYKYDDAVYGILARSTIQVYMSCNAKEFSHYAAKSGYNLFTSL